MFNKMLCLVLLVHCAASCHGYDKPTKSYNANQKKGSTKVYGKAWLTERDNGSYYGQIQVVVTKAGVAGTGWGNVRIMLMGSGGNIIFSTNQTATVGAIVATGLASKESPIKTFDLNAIDGAKVVAVVVHTEVEDRNGIVPSSPEDVLKKIIGGWDTLTGIFNRQADPIEGTVIEIRIGKTVKGIGSPHVFCLYADTKLYVPDPETMLYYMLKYDEVPLGEIERIKTTGVIPSRAKRKLIRANGTAEVYDIIDGKRRNIPDPETLRAMGFSVSEIEIMPPDKVLAIPLGAPFPKKEVP